MLNPATKFKIVDIPDMIYNIIYLPYWQMYGELNLENIEHKNKTVCYKDAFCEDFTVYNHVTRLLLAVYLLVGNVMLLNLLIAIFTSVFEDVQENSKEVWKYEMYRLVEEYDQKPGLAPPFVIIEDLYRFGKQVWKWTCRGEKENLEIMMSATLETLDLFERDSLNAYVIKKSKDESNKMDSKMSVIEDKMSKVLECFEENPVNAANDWGEEITTGTKLYSSSSSSDSDHVYEKTINKAYNQKTRKKKIFKKAPMHVLFKENEKDNRSVICTSETQDTAAPKNKSRPTEENIEKLEMKISLLEERTSTSLTKLEEMLINLQRTLDNV